MSVPASSASSASSDRPSAGMGELELAEARRLYESGLSFSELGRRLGRSKGYLSQQFACAGIPVRPRGRNVLDPEPAIDVDELVRLRETGATFARLGELFGVAPGYARARYRRARRLLRGDDDVSSHAPTPIDLPAGRALASRRRDFFADFAAEVIARRPEVRPSAPQEKSWLSWGWGPFGCWCITAPRARLVRVEARIDLLDQALNKRLFDELIAERDSWVSRISVGVTCDRLDDHRSSRICAYRVGHFLEDDASREQALAWSVSSFVEMHDALDPLLRRLALKLRGAPDDPNGG